MGGGKGVRHDGRAIAIQRQRCPRPGPAVSADAAQGQLVLVEKREKEEGSETEHLPPSSERLGQGSAWAPAEDIQLTRRDHCARGARAGKYQAAHSIYSLLQKLRSIAGPNGEKHGPGRRTEMTDCDLTQQRRFDCAVRR